MTQAFGGFQRDTLDFLRDLGANNTKEWFDAHRAEYERSYVTLAFAFIAAMAEPLSRLDPEVRADPRVNARSSGSIATFGSAATRPPIRTTSTYSSGWAKAAVESAPASSSDCAPIA